jgi:lipopolysaccharide transport system ATP-binding protein
MNEIVICAENLGKKYAIAHQMPDQHETLRDTLTKGAKSLANKLLMAVKRDRRSRKEDFWALKDVSFEIKQGDRVGIIGRNGAGKSTLLKILSQITEPTTGEVEITGRVASLLEVGTGFHPELTGRENIYLNGVILGMNRNEINRKFDEMVAFAEIDKFLDTPVKRYSSGMYVRLAFSIAAHLEPEILIVDEVLAVGDIQFQKKCLGKMQDISDSEGRTVLFVSHNMDAIQRLCSQCMMLERGQLVWHGDTETALQKYISSGVYQAAPNQWINLSNVARMGTGEARFIAARYSSLDEMVLFQPYPNGTIEFLLKIESDASRSIASVAVVISSQIGTILVNADTISIGQQIDLEKGMNIVNLTIEQLYLKPGIYVLGLWMDKTGNNSGCDALDYIETAFELEVVSREASGFGWETMGAVVCNFKVLKLE